MTMPELVDWVEKVWPYVVVSIIFVIPTIWYFIDYIYKNRLSMLKDEVELLRSRGQVQAQATENLEQLIKTDSFNSQDIESAEEADANSSGYPDFMDLGPKTEYITDLSPINKSAKSIIDSLSQVPPLRRERWAENKYKNRWLKGSGEVRDVKEIFGLIQLFLVDSSDGSVFLGFPTSEKADLESLSVGQKIKYSGQIHRVDTHQVNLVYPEIELTYDNGHANDD